MIYQLVRRSPAWRALAFLVIAWFAITLGATLPHFLHLEDEALTAFLTGMSVPGILITALFLIATRRASLFEAALPISARDLFLARVVSLLVFVWLQVAAVIVPICLTGYPPSTSRILGPVQAGAVATLMGLLILSVRLRELSAPARPAVALGGIALLGGGLTIILGVPAGIVLAVCAVASAAALWRDLARMPRAFEVAPPDSSAAEQPDRPREPSARPVWWPMIRCLFDWLPAAYLGAAMVWSAVGAWYIAPMMITAFVVYGWNSFRWAWPLPITRRKVLAAMLVPPLACEVGAQTVRFAYAGWPVRATVIATVAVLGLSLLAVSAAFLMYNWRALRGASRFLALFYSVAFLVSPWAAYIADIHYGRPHGPYRLSFTAEFLAVRLAGVLPNAMPLLAAGGAILLFVLYRLVERQFETSEFLQFPQVRPAGGGDANPWGLS
jgi:hypothetical protein